MSAPLLFCAERIAKRFGGFTALDSVDFEVSAGERVGLIGPNGSGKSTLVGCASGSLRNNEGAIWFEGRRIDRLSPHERVRAGLVRSFQLPRPFRALTVAENLRVPLFFARRSGQDSRAIDEALEFVGLSKRRDAMPADLTQVDLRKLDLARATVAKPRLLFVDEAMAGLSQSEVDEILALLMRMNARGVAIVMIEHIMRAVTSFSQRLVVLVAGRKIADGDPTKVLADADVQRAYLGE
jgi:branched-chain amino acid transport system ATP-binding protein